MQLRYRNVLPLVAICLSIAVAPALASRPAPTPVSVPGGVLPAPTGTTGTNATCSLGQTFANAAYIWFFPSDDYYYTLFDPATCGCASGKVRNYVAHWALFWPQGCMIHAQVWILPAQQTAPGCYVPVTGVAGTPPDPTAGLCNSAVVLLDGTPGGLIDHAVPLPATCNCLNGGPFFVLFKLIDSPGCPVRPDGALDSPAIVVDATPDLCTSYNSFLGGAPQDMVAAFTFPGNTTMWVDVDCCDVVPTLPGSWGKIKTIYR